MRAEDHLIGVAAATTPRPQRLGMHLFEVIARGRRAVRGQGPGRPGGRSVEAHLVDDARGRRRHRPRPLRIPRCTATCSPRRSSRSPHRPGRPRSGWPDASEGADGADGPEPSSQGSRSPPGQARPRVLPPRSPPRRHAPHRRRRQRHHRRRHDPRTAARVLTEHGVAASTPGASSPLVRHAGWRAPQVSPMVLGGRSSPWTWGARDGSTTRTTTGHGAPGGGAPRWAVTATRRARPTRHPGPRGADHVGDGRLRADTTTRVHDPTTSTAPTHQDGSASTGGPRQITRLGPRSQGAEAPELPIVAPHQLSSSHLPYGT